MIAVIKTFKRPESCVRAVDSIHEHLDIPVIVVSDDGSHDDYHADYTIRTPFDIGLSAGRNIGMQLAKKLSDKVILFDDDHVLDGGCGIKQAAWMLNEYDVVTGQPFPYERDRGPYYWEWTFSFPAPGKMVLTPQHERGIVHAANNFFIARSEVFDEVLWDERFKISAEHLDFFMQLYFAGKTVFFEPSMSVLHRQNHPEGYDDYRLRLTEYDKLFFEKWGLSECRATDGTRMP